MNLKRVEGYVLKTQADCYKALLEGYYLSSGFDTVFIDKNGYLSDISGYEGHFSFKEFKAWGVFEDISQWYDEIPENGILCWVSDYDDINPILFPRTVDVIYKMHRKEKMPKLFEGRRESWVYAKPVSLEDIQDLLQPIDL